MTTTFPGAVDAFPNPTPTDTLASPSHAGQHANANDAIEALERWAVTLDAKPTGNGLPGYPIEWANNDSFGFLLHLVSGAAMTGGGMLGIGVGSGNNDSTAIVGLYVSNLRKGVGIKVNNADTISDALAFGYLGTQSSTLAPMMSLQQLVAGAAPVLSLLTTVQPSAGQLLAEFYSYATAVNGPFGYWLGRIRADTGKLDWYHDIRADGARFVALDADVASTDQHQIHVSSTAVKFAIVSGLADNYWLHRIRAGGQSIVFEYGGLGTIDGGSYTVKAMEIGPSSGGVAQIGFFGATPAVKPIGVAVSAAGIHAALVTLGLIAA